MKYKEGDEIRACTTPSGTGSFFTIKIAKVNATSYESCYYFDDTPSAITRWSPDDRAIELFRKYYVIANSPLMKALS